jgi:uncharacterized protein YcbK (DUF882 family)
MNLTKNFTLEELTYSDVAVKNSIENTPDGNVKKSLAILAADLLQPLRDHIGKPITILSGYRSKAVNKMVGGVKNSQHLIGQAVDCTIDAGPEKLLVALKASNLDFDQAILYRGNFLHLSYKPGRNRKMMMLG